MLNCPGGSTDDFPTSALSRALKSGGALGPAAKDRADSDSEDDAGGLGLTLDAARRLAARSGAGDADDLE